MTIGLSLPIRLEVSTHKLKQKRGSTRPVTSEHQQFSYKTRDLPEARSRTTKKYGLCKGESEAHLIESPIDAARTTVLSDVSTEKTRPIVPVSLRRQVCDSIHSLSHPSVRAFIKLLYPIFESLFKHHFYAIQKLANYFSFHCSPLFPYYCSCCEKYIRNLYSSNPCKATHSHYDYNAILTLLVLLRIR